MKLEFAYMVLIVLSLSACQRNKNSVGQTSKKNVAKVDLLLANDTVFKSNSLMLLRLTHHVYQHVSFLNTQDFGRVACNGMIVVNNDKAVVFDTPADDSSSAELIEYVTKNLKSKIIAVVPTHFHKDCVGGLAVFEQNEIPALASDRTIKILQEKNLLSMNFLLSFHDSLILDIGGKQVVVNYLGAGHTKDNVVAYFPADSVLFGGCLIKEMGATKGNLEDADVKAWPETVKNLQQKYPGAKIVIPGHGKAGGRDLLDYTLKLFR